MLPLSALFQNEDDEGEDDGDDSGTDHLSEKSGTQLQRCERHKAGSSRLPDTFQTSNLLFYERFKAYQDYMLGNRDFRSADDHRLQCFKYMFIGVCFVCRGLQALRGASLHSRLPGQGAGAM